MPASEHTSRPPIHISSTMGAEGRPKPTEPAPAPSVQIRGTLPGTSERGPRTKVGGDLGRKLHDERRTSPDRHTSVGERAGASALRTSVETGRGEKISEITHAPTWHNGPYPKNRSVGYGTLAKDGVEARLNNAYAGQDAFAVSADRRRSAVADGMGGATDKEGTAFFARFLTDRVVTEGVDIIFDETKVKKLYAQADSAFRAESGRGFRTTRISGPMVTSVGATLGFSEMLSPTKARLVIVGDALGLVLDKSKNIVHAYGEDMQTGEEDAPLAHKIGLNAQGEPIVPTRDYRNNRKIVDREVDIPAGGSVAIATDYFTDIVMANQPMGGFTGLTADQYFNRTSASGKDDDAALVVTTPQVVA